MSLKRKPEAMTSTENPDTWDTDSSDDDIISKSELKRIAESKQLLGKELASLSADKLNEFSLPDELTSAIHAYQKMNSHSAMKRQMQFIGKLMRNIDTEPVAHQLNLLQQQSQKNSAHHHMLEQWRERLLEDSTNVALTELMAKYPFLDAQHIRQLIRNSQRESAAAKPPKSFRLLFQYLKQMIK